jgi:hypothetical protein
MNTKFSWGNLLESDNLEDREGNGKITLHVIVTLE